MTMRTACLCLSGMLILSAASSAKATVFFNDDFSYGNGALVTVSAGTGDWTTHSGTAAQMLVVDGQAEIKLSAGEDVSRSTGQVIPEGGSWYYAALIKVDDLRTVTTDLIQSTNYFMHFKDEGTSSFRSRLYLRPPNNAADNATKFTFGLSASSLTGGGAQVPYTLGDFSYDTDIVVVAKYTSADGLAETPDEGFGQLWVNPASSASPSIIDSLPNTNFLTDDAMSRLAFRQGGGTLATAPAVYVNKAAIGDSFAEVLAAVAPVTADDADFDNDLDVDGDDFLIWQRGLGVGTTNATGDANSSSTVDGADLTIWKAKFGLPVAVPAVGAVPEPACLTLAALGLVAAVAAGRRRGC